MSNGPIKQTQLATGAQQKIELMLDFVLKERTQVNHQQSNIITTMLNHARTIKNNINETLHETLK